ncbi:uncharacterized protein V1518DRAFT_440403 [Limtongia smithiae]|uniref:uncharacterized protein n=1 Tax=Limtongia smithiae TaxID=1125753 RepID=UPI0034CFB1B3
MTVLLDQQFVLLSTLAAAVAAAAAGPALAQEDIVSPMLTAASAVASTASSTIMTSMASVSSPNLTAVVTNIAAAAAVAIDDSLASQSATIAPATASPFISQFSRIMRSLASVIVKQTSEVDIPDRRIGTFVAYLTSPFALLCMLMAVILNRTVVFASVRRPQSLPASARLLIRSVAIFQLARASLPLFTALKCYSPGLAPYIPEYFAIDAAGGEKCPGPDILWYLYKAFCTGHFVETFSSALQGRMPSPDTGMTLFEYSLAFQEAQSAQRPSVEVLVISLIWAINYLTFLIISVLDLQNYRLIPSSFFGIISLTYFALSTYNGRAQFFPTVWVIGFAPHLAVLYVIIICGAIYFLASIFAGGPTNLQSSVRTVSVSLSEDFYSCLLKLGVFVLTSASDATYMAEGPSLAIPETTWIETLDYKNRAGFEYINEDPLNIGADSTHNTDGEYEHDTKSLRKRIKFTANSTGDYNTILNTGFGIATTRQGKKRGRKSGGRHGIRAGRGSFHEVAGNGATHSGYASHNARVGAGVNGRDSSNRQVSRFRLVVLVYRVRMAYKLVSWCFKLCVSVVVGAIYRLTRKLGSEQAPEQNIVEVLQENTEAADRLEARILSDDDYYALFLTGQQLPEDDLSGDFEPSDDEEDEDFSSSEAEDENAATSSSSSSSLPQRANYETSELYPELANTDISLASLLVPRTREESQLAHVMTAHFMANEIVTRAKMEEFDEDYYPDDSDSDGLFDEESAMLISLINERRRRSEGSGSLQQNDYDPFDGTETTSSYRPSLCVVCHSAQRDIVLWPCKCLAVCEECRVSLALRNFKGCVCCRRDVVSFSRLYVP